MQWGRMKEGRMRVGMGTCVGFHFSKCVLNSLKMTLVGSTNLLYKSDVSTQIQINSRTREEGGEKQEKQGE